MWKHHKFSDEYFSQIITMTKEQYGENNDIAHEDFLHYQYFKNPAGDAIIDLAVNEETGEIAGQYIVLPMRFEVFGEKRKCVCSLNTLTRKEYRGQKIFTKLAEISYRTAGIKHNLLCYGVPNPNSYHGFIKKLNFYELGSIPLMLKPLCLSQMVSEYMANKVFGKLCTPANLLFTVKKTVPEKNVKFFEVTKENIYLIDEFWKSICGKYNIMNVRDGAYIKFRYLDMPRRTYYPYIAIYNGKPVCFAVGRIMEVAGIQCAMLADFIYQDGFESIAKELVQHILVILKQKGASLAGCLMFEHTREHKILKKLGFMRCPKMFEPQPFPLLVRKFDDTIDSEKVLNCKNWFFTMGDYDVI